MPSKERYQAIGSTVDELRNSLNFALQRIGDRLDKLEGIRGKPDLLAVGLDVVGDVEVKDADGKVIHSME